MAFAFVVTCLQDVLVHRGMLCFVCKNCHILLTVCKCVAMFQEFRTDTSQTHVWAGTIQVTATHKTTTSMHGQQMGVKASPKGAHGRMEGALDGNVCAHGRVKGAHGVLREQGGSRSEKGNESGDREGGSRGKVVVDSGKEYSNIVQATMGYNVLGQIFVSTEELEAIQGGAHAIVSVNVMDAFGLCMPRHPDYTGVMVSSSSFLEQVIEGDFGLGWQAPAFNSLQGCGLLRSDCTVMLSPVRHADNWILLVIHPATCMVYILQPQQEVSLQPRLWQLIKTFIARLSRLFNTLQHFKYRDSHTYGSGPKAIAAVPSGLQVCSMMLGFVGVIEGNTSDIIKLAIVNASV
jgi:hypothetical protein